MVTLERKWADSQMPKELRFWRQPSVREVTGFLTAVMVLEGVVFAKMKNTGSFGEGVSVTEFEVPWRRL